MGKQEELAKLDRAIKDCEARLKTFEANVNTIKKEISILETAENQLEENIGYLKKNKTVALAIEYKKAKEDLKKTKVRILQLKSDAAINERVYKDTQDVLNKNKEMYDKFAKQNDNNVVQGKFGRKRD
jgi:chromosome segregation ATPase